MPGCGACGYNFTGSGKVCTCTPAQIARYSEYRTKLAEERKARNKDASAATPRAVKTQRAVAALGRMLIRVTTGRMADRQVTRLVIAEEDRGHW